VFLLVEEYAKFRYIILLLRFFTCPVVSYTVYIILVLVYLWFLFRNIRIYYRLYLIYIKNLSRTCVCLKTLRHDDNDVTVRNQFKSKNSNCVFSSAKPRNLYIECCTTSNLLHEMSYHCYNVIRNYYYNVCIY